MPKDDHEANIYSYSPAEVNEGIRETYAEFAKADTPNANGDVIGLDALLEAIKPIVQLFALPAGEGSPDDQRTIQVDPASGPDETVIRGFPAPEFVHTDIGLGDRLWEETVIRAMGVPPDFLAEPAQVQSLAEDDGRALVHEVGQVKRIKGDRGRGVVMLQRPIPGARVASLAPAYIDEDGRPWGEPVIVDMVRRETELASEVMGRLINQAGPGMVVEDINVQQDPGDPTKINVTGRARPWSMREAAKAYFNQKWLEERIQEFRKRR